eukprot:9402-Heterococcus_DN1.PRE.1
MQQHSALLVLRMVSSFLLSASSSKPLRAPHHSLHAHTTSWHSKTAATKQQWCNSQGHDCAEGIMIAAAMPCVSAYNRCTCFTKPCWQANCRHTLKQECSML